MVALSSGTGGRTLASLTDAGADPDTEAGYGGVVSEAFRAG